MQEAGESQDEKKTSSQEEDHHHHERSGQQQKQQPQKQQQRKLSDEEIKRRARRSTSSTTVLSSVIPYNHVEPSDMVLPPSKKDALQPALTDEEIKRRARRSTAGGGLTSSVTAIIRHNNVIEQPGAHHVVQDSSSRTIKAGLRNNSSRVVGLRNSTTTTTAGTMMDESIKSSQVGIHTISEARPRGKVGLRNSSQRSSSTMNDSSRSNHVGATASSAVATTTIPETTRKAQRHSLSTRRSLQQKQQHPGVQSMSSSEEVRKSGLRSSNGMSTLSLLQEHFQRQQDEDMSQESGGLEGDLEEIDVDSYMKSPPMKSPKGLEQQQQQPLLCIKCGISLNETNQYSTNLLDVEMAAAVDSTQDSDHNHPVMAHLVVDMEDEEERERFILQAQKSAEATVRKEIMSDVIQASQVVDEEFVRRKRWYASCCTMFCLILIMTTIFVLVSQLRPDPEVVILGEGAGESDITSVAQPPANDLCIGSTDMKIGSSTAYQWGNLQFASNVSFPTCDRSVQTGGKGLWYKIKGTGSPMQVSTCRSNNTVDTQITVFQGASCDSLFCVAANDDDPMCFDPNEDDESSSRLLDFSSAAVENPRLDDWMDELNFTLPPSVDIGLGSTVSWESVEGVTYFICVHAKVTMDVDTEEMVEDWGSFDLEITSTAKNDYCSGATPVRLGFLEQQPPTPELLQPTTTTTELFPDRPTLVNTEQPARNQAIGGGSSSSNIMLVTSAPKETNSTSSPAAPYYLDEYGSTEMASIDLDRDIVFCDGTDNSAPGVWYRILGTGKALTAMVHPKVTDFNTQIAVFHYNQDLRDFATNPFMKAASQDSLICETFRLECLVGDQGYYSWSSQVHWTAQANQFYYIYVAGVDRQRGNFELYIEEDESRLDCLDALDLDDITTTQEDNFPTNILFRNESFVDTLVHFEEQQQQQQQHLKNVITCGNAIHSNGRNVWLTLMGTGEIMSLSTCHALQNDGGTAMTTTSAIISIFEGMDCRNLQCIKGLDMQCSSSNTTKLEWSSELNQRYYILVSPAMNTLQEVSIRLSLDKSH